MKNVVILLLIIITRNEANALIRSITLSEMENLQVQKPYSTANNFTGKIIYPADQLDLSTECQLEESVISKMKMANKKLAEIAPALHFLVFDCYRPNYAQVLLWEAHDCNNPQKNCIGFIAPPGKSKHNFGKALDITLADENGTPIQMPTEYDKFSDNAMPKHQDLWDPISKGNWLILNQAMSAGGCKVISSEWWHFDC